MKRFLIVIFFSILLIPTISYSSTCLQRFTAICNALVDGISTTEQKTRFGNSFVEESRAWIVSKGVDPDSLTTNEQKACVVVKKLKEDFNAIANRKHVDVLTAKDGVETAKAGVEAAAVTAAADAEADWPKEVLE